MASFFEFAEVVVITILIMEVIHLPFNSESKDKQNSEPVHIQPLQYLLDNKWNAVISEDFSSYNKLSLKIINKKGKILLFENESLIHSTDTLANMCIYLYDNKMI